MTEVPSATAQGQPGLVRGLDIVQLEMNDHCTLRPGCVCSVRDMKCVRTIRSSSSEDACRLQLLQGERDEHPSDGFACLAKESTWLKYASEGGS